MKSLFVVRDEKILENLIAFIRGNGFTLDVEVREHKKTRTKKQNSLYWSLIGIIAKDKGYDSEDLHLALKIKFLGTTEKQIAGQTYIIPNSTTKLTTTQFGEYVDRVYALGAELGVKLPQASFWGLDD